MTDLKPRQQQLLKAIIDEYVETAEAVGSETLVKKYNLGVSPATIRNEMVNLTELGYLKQPHTSAGRIPTSMGMKFYINALMKEAQLPVKEEVAIKEELWDKRFEIDRLLRQSTRQLSQRTNNLALVVTDEGDVYYSGISLILDAPEFFDIDLTKTVLMVMDREDMLEQIFNRAVGEEPVHILLGDELGLDYLDQCGVVFAHFGSGKRLSGAIGVVGPVRMRYPHVIPTVRYFGNLLSDLARGW
jgi:heat-inducible transcriptional repressor